MTKELQSLDFLECTKCHADSPLEVHSTPDQRSLKCRTCGAEFPMVANVVRMISKERDADTLKKFEHQWKVWGGDAVVFGDSAKGHEERFFKACPDPKFSRAWFNQKKVLDAGCGHGLVVEAFDNLGADAVGLDFGDGIFRAAKRLEHKNNLFVQGDILDIPFREASFDFVHCCGVIHHTRDPRLALKKLASVVKPGGGLYIWVYPVKGWLWETTMATARAFTTRMPPALLSALSYLLVPLLYVVPAFSKTSPRKNSLRQCAQVIYDWLSPKYQSHHTFNEIKRWFEEEGFDSVAESDEYPLSVYGIKKQQ